MNENIQQMLAICQGSELVSASAARLLARYESDIKRAFGAAGTVDAKVAMIDYHREQLARGLSLLVIIAQGNMTGAGDQVDQIEQLGTTRHDGDQLGTVIGHDGDRTIRTMPADIRAGIDQWALTPPAGIDQTPEELPAELPPVPELPPPPADVPEVPELPPPPADVPEVPELPPPPAHPTRREHPARPSNKRRKPN